MFNFNTFNTCGPLLWHEVYCEHTFIGYTQKHCLGYRDNEDKGHFVNKTHILHFKQMNFSYS